MLRIILPALVVTAVALWSAVPAAQGQVPASENAGGTSHESNHDQVTGEFDWVIGSETDRIDVILDPDAGPWIKHLRGPAGQIVTADDTGSTAPSIFNLVEHLHVGGAIAWTDWHEEILTPGWYPRVFQVLANGAPVPGLQVTYTDPDWPRRGGAADLAFPALPPCTNVSISKQLVWEGNPQQQGDRFFGTVNMAQYPTPEPAALSMLGLGWLGLLRKRRR